MVIFLSTGMLEELSRRLVAGGYQENTPAAIVYKATWADEEKYVCTVGSLAQTAREHGITKTALIIVGDVICRNSIADGFIPSGIHDRISRGEKSGSK